MNNRSEATLTALALFIAVTFIGAATLVTVCAIKVIDLVTP